MSERDDLYARLAGAIHSTVDPMLALSAGMNDFMDPGRPFVVFCKASPLHEEIVVATLYPEGIFQSMFHESAAWLEDDTVFRGTLLDAAMRERQAVVQGTERPNIRRRYRLACPVCGDSGDVAEFGEDVDFIMMKLRAYLDLTPSVSRMDIETLARYLNH